MLPSSFEMLVIVGPLLDVRRAKVSMQHQVVQGPMSKEEEDTEDFG